LKDGGRPTGIGLGRYAGLTGSPDESGAKRRDKRIGPLGQCARAARHVQLVWRFLLFQKDSALAQWDRQRTAAAPSTRKTLIVALFRVVSQLPPRPASRLNAGILGGRSARVFPGFPQRSKYEGW
jgi:hypothetical protein